MKWITMVTVNPDKKRTKRGWIRTLFSPFVGASARRAVLAHRDAADARQTYKDRRAEIKGLNIKELKKRGILR